MDSLKDIQNLHDERGIGLQKVGVKKVRMPLQILTKNDDYQQVLGGASLAADLCETLRGTHMSRFMEILTKWSKKPMSSIQIREILLEVKQKLQTKRAQVAIHFPYFIEKTSPVSGSTGVIDYDCLFYGLMDEDKFSFIMGITVPVQLVCPCSKEISRHGAHNQRADINIRLEYYPNTFIWLEDLIEIVESAGSSSLYPVIKREDEKYITEYSYENPKFVEDVVRDLVEFFRGDERIRWFEIECDSYESIHNHNAFAYQKEYRNRKKEIKEESSLIPIPNLNFMFS